MRSMRLVGIAVAALVVMGSVLEAQDRPASPRGFTATQFGGSYDAEGAYQGGHWIDIRYGRPILRGRQGIFGEGAEYGQQLYAGAPLWRVGADQTTRFVTEADLLIGGQRLAAGEYTMFVDLADPTAWTLIFTTWSGNEDPRADDTNALWGAYGYTDEKDVMRATMTVNTVDLSLDNLFVGFMDMTQQGGEFFILWDNQRAGVELELAN